MLGFALRMLAWYGLFHVLYFRLPIPFLHDQLYPTLFGHPSAVLIELMSADEAVTVTANRIASPRAILEIVRGCDGSGVLFLITAAILSFPASWKARAWGVGLAAALVYGLNLARLVGLFFIAVYRQSWFLSLHTYFIPTLLILAIALFYLRWISHVAPLPHE